jgi:hypothetical protein
MTATFTRWARRAAETAAFAALPAVLTACSMGSGTSDTTAPTAAQSAPPGRSTEQVVLRFGEHAVAATLVDSPAARELARMLPVTIELEETWGQAKSGRMPQPVSVEGAARTLTPVPGGIYYWSDTATLAVYYDDLGQAVPPPGLVQFGVLDTGVNAVADLGRQVTVRIDRATAGRSGWGQGRRGDGPRGS